MKFTIFSCRSRDEITYLIKGFAPCLLSAVDTSTQENICTYEDELNNSGYYTMLNTKFWANDLLLLLLLLLLLQ